VAQVPLQTLRTCLEIEVSEHIRESKRMAQVLFWILNKETAED